jgi:hypothetical protein
MRRLTVLVALAFALSVGATEAANPKTSSKPTGAGKPTITKTQTSKGSAAKGQSAKAKGSTVKTTGAQAKAPKTTTTSAKPAKSDAKVAKADAKTKKPQTKSTTTAATSTTSTTTTPGSIDFTSTALGQKLQKNSALRSKIEAKLAAAGYTGTIYEAAFGYKNLGQLNATTNQVQNHGTSFELLKVLMTGRYVDPVTHQVYRATQLPDGTLKLVNPELATNPASSLSLGQAKQAITGGAEMPVIVPYTPTTTTTNTSTN